MDLDFSALNSLKKEGLNSPLSIGNDKTLRSTHKEEEIHPQGKYEGESGNCYNKPNQIQEGNERTAEIYQKQQENIRKSDDLIPEIVKGILAADNPYMLLLKAVKCIGLMTGNGVIYNQCLTDMKAVYGIGLHDPQTIEIELQETDSRLAKLWEAIKDATPEEEKSIERAIEAHEQRIEYLKKIAS